MWISEVSFYSRPSRFRSTRQPDGRLPRQPLVKNPTGEKEKGRPLIAPFSRSPVVFGAGMQRDVGCRPGKISPRRDNRMDVCRDSRRSRTPQQKKRRETFDGSLSHVLLWFFGQGTQRDIGCRPGGRCPASDRQESPCRVIRNRSPRLPPRAGGLTNSSTSTPPLASITRCDGMLSGSVVIST